MQDNGSRIRAVIRFKRKVSFPSFSMEPGSRWSFIVFGKLEKRLAAVKAGASFDFAGGQCLAGDVELIYEGPPGIEYAIAAGLPVPTNDENECAEELAA